MTADKESLAALSKRADEIHNRSEAIGRELIGLTSQAILDVARGIDPVTTALHQLFSKPVEETANELQRARLRRERGNPPGKRTDPLGDQLTWEQFLSSISGQKAVWIITGDADYRYKLPEGGFALNPILQEDVFRAAGGKPEIHCFDTLAEGLDSAVAVLKKPPVEQVAKEELNKIKEEERSNAATRRMPSVLCPACGNVTPWLAVRPAQGYFGGVVFFKCPHCGNQFDTDVQVP